jgi:hypothetical protein
MTNISENLESANTEWKRSYAQLAKQVKEHTSGTQSMESLRRINELVESGEAQIATEESNGPSSKQ